MGEVLEENVDKKWAILASQKCEIDAELPNEKEDLNMTGSLLQFDRFLEGRSLMIVFLNFASRGFGIDVGN